MALNTTNFAAGQPTTLSVDGIVTQGGISTSIIAATIKLQFDPTKVSLSSFTAPTGSGWTVLGYNLDEVSEGWAIAIVLNLDGQTTNGPLINFTVTPSDSSVMVDDCATLKLGASGSDLCDDIGYDYKPTDACGGAMQAMAAASSPEDAPAGSTVQGATDCQPDLPDAILALQVTGGLSDSQTDFSVLDKDGDGAVTLVDVLLLLRPCMAEPLGWYTLQGNCRRTGRLNAAIPDNPSQVWTVPLDRAHARWRDTPLQGGELQPSVVAVPNPTAPSSWPLVFAAVNDLTSTVYPGDGNYIASKLYRIEDTGTSASTPSSGQWVFDNVATEGTQPIARGFVVSGIMAVTDTADGTLKIIVTGNESYLYSGISSHCHVYAFDAAHISDGPVWDRRMPGSILCSPAYSPIDTTYYLRSSGGSDSGASNQCGAVLVAYTTGGSTPPSYMLALNVHNGVNCWGTVYGYSNATAGIVEGDLVPNVNGTLGGLPQMSGAATLSSPSRDDYSAYVGNAAGLLDVRDLVTGAAVAGPDFGGSTWLGGHPVQSSPTLFEDKVYLATSDAGFMASGLITNEEGVRGGSPLWLYITGLHPAYATPAFWREGRTTFLPDLQGNIAGVGTDNDPGNFGRPYPKWSPPFVITDGIVAAYASPLVAGAPGSSTARVFVATDDKYVNNAYYPAYVNVIDAATGNQAYTSLGPLNGKVRASMAAYKPRNNASARLYVLSMGTSATDGPRLYCFGSP